MTLQAIRWENGKLEVLDQLLLPAKTKYVEIENVHDAWLVIRNMQVRGAPAIALVACLAIVMDVQHVIYLCTQDLYEDVKSKAAFLLQARPTAVNIRILAEHLLHVIMDLTTKDLPLDFIKKQIAAEATAMLERDIADNKALGDFGATEVLKNYPNVEKVTILTHCNTGSLATAGYGTALGVIRSLHNNGKLDRAYCTETRPYNQGARLTAYELVHDNIPGTLICDNMVAALMKIQKVHAVVVGADRIALNGDTANKIGTYQIAILAKHYNIPFYVAAPVTTIDFGTENGDKIKIEHRCEKELTHVNNVRIAAEGIDVWNPAFDVTPAEYVTGIITEKGVLRTSEISSLREDDLALAQPIS